MSRRSRTVLAIAFVSLLGVLALMQLTTRETRALEPVEPATQAAPNEQVGLETSLVSAARDDRVTHQVEDLTVADAVDAHEDDASLDEKVAPPPRPISLLVHFVDERGNAVTLGQPGVSAWSRDGDEEYGDEVEPGTCEFRGLPPGAWQIVATASGFHDAKREVIIARSDAALEVEIALIARWSVRIVLLTLKGEPYPTRSRIQFDAIVTREPPGERIAGKLGSKGVLQCGYLDESLDAAGDRRQLGIVVPMCEPPLWISLTTGGHVVESRRLELGTDEVVFLLDPEALDEMPASVRLRLIDGATHAPLNGTTVELRCGPRIRMLSSSHDGFVEFTEVPPGVSELQISVPGYEYVLAEIIVPSGAHLDLGDVPLSAIGSGDLRVRCDVPEGVDQFETCWTRMVSVRENGSYSTYETTSTLPRDQAVIRLGRGDWRVWCHAKNGEQRFRSRTFDVTMNGSSLEVATRVELVARMVLVPATSARRVTITDVTEGRGPASVHEVGSQVMPVELPVGRFEVVVHRPDETETKMTVDLEPEGARVILE